MINLTTTLQQTFRWAVWQWEGMKSNGVSRRRQYPTVDKAPNTTPSHCQLTESPAILRSPELLSSQSSSAKLCPGSVAASATTTHPIAHVTWPRWSR
ncbi:hypothetical protein BDN67DRAFT_971051 [Paxillus ammoniavirescens]|nr:hypothetical protein BDN67DRAFT_971051 [Paxillus ammoniavirescens]